MSIPIHFKQEGALGRVVLDRPEALNALSLPMIQACYQQLLTWAEDPSVERILFESSTSKAFCAGGDVRFIYTERHQSVQREFFEAEYRLNGLIGSLKKPCISLMNGITMGGGVGIGLHGSHPVATERFIFAMPETAIGLFPDVGASHLLARLPKGIGMYLALTGQRLNALEAHALGLVRYVMPEVDMQGVMSQLRHGDPDTVLQAAQVKTLPTPTEFQSKQSTIASCFSQASVEAIMAALRALNDAWGEKTLATLDAMSPTSLKVTFMQMQRAAGRCLADCLKTDGLLVKHFIADHDFYEGVRAMLIDKDKQPQWAPATLAEVSEARVLGYFSG